MDILSSEKAPGQRECTEALDTLNKQLRTLDQVALQAVSQELEPRHANTLQGEGILDLMTYNIVDFLILLTSYRKMEL